jgi:hypothetical protein
VNHNSLHAFYPEDRIREIVNRLCCIDFPALARAINVPEELVYDFAPLALYDVVFYCDDSASMAFEERGSRIDDLKLITSRVSEIVSRFDDDGINVCFMNSSQVGDGVKTAAQVLGLIQNVSFSGSTPLGTNFKTKVVDRYVLKRKAFGMGDLALQKPVLAIIITDGEPVNEPRQTIVDVLIRTKQSLASTKFGSKALAVEIAQVGRDQKAQDFLAWVDNHPDIADVVDCTSYYELEAMEFQRKGVQLTPELWILKMCMGAVDPEYDDKD